MHEWLHQLTCCLRCGLWGRGLNPQEHTWTCAISVVDILNVINVIHKGAAAVLALASFTVATCYHYWHCPHSMCDMRSVELSGMLLSVCLSVCLSVSSSRRMLLLQVCCCGPGAQEILISCCSSDGRLRAVPRCQHT